MRGSFRPSAIRLESTSRSASLTRRIRSVATLLPQYLARRDEAPLEADAVRKLRQDVALEVVGGLLERAGLAAGERSEQRGALPQLVMIGLGDRRPEPSLQLSLQRKQFLPLALERPVPGEMKMNLDE